MTALLQSAPDSLAAFFHGTAVAPAAQTGWIKITGPDSVRWLNGMVTNSVQALESGHGAYTFLLNAQGRIQGDGIVWASADALFLQTSADQTTPLMELLDRFIIMDEVELADVSSSMHGLRLAGPDAQRLLQDLGLDPPSAAYGSHRRNWIGHSITVQTMHAPLAPQFQLWAETEQTTADLMGALLAHGATQTSEAGFETLRILEGTPLFGKDIRDRDLPQETAQDRALHFNKGCYLGQEIVERIRSRGAVHRTFHAFLLEGEIPAAGTVLESDDKSVGELTSIAALPGATIALGYVRREALERGLPITFQGGAAKAVPSPVALPQS